MRLGYLCYLGYSDYCPHLYCYIHNVSADVTSGLHQVLPVELGNLLFELGNLLFELGNFLVVIGIFTELRTEPSYLIHGGRLSHSET